MLRELAARPRLDRVERHRRTWLRDRSRGSVPGPPSLAAPQGRDDPSCLHGRRRHARRARGNERATHPNRCDPRRGGRGSSWWPQSRSTVGRRSRTSHDRPPMSSSCWSFARPSYDAPAPPRTRSIDSSSSDDNPRLPTVATFCSSWATELAPTSVEVTLGSRSVHASASWASVCPRAAAMSASARRLVRSSSVTPEPDSDPPPAAASRQGCRRGSGRSAGPEQVARRRCIPFRYRRRRRGHRARSNGRASSTTAGG